MPVGPTKPDGLLVLGSGPTRDDVKEGEPLSGHAGREMEQVFEEAGIKRERLRIVTAWACQPHEPRKEAEERKATLCCKPHVWNSIKDLPVSTPVLICGKWAQLSLSGSEDGLFSKRGFVDMKWTLQDKK